MASAGEIRIQVNPIIDWDALVDEVIAARNAAMVKRGKEPIKVVPAPADYGPPPVDRSVVDAYRPTGVELKFGKFDGDAEELKRFQERVDADTRRLAVRFPGRYGYGSSIVGGNYHESGWSNDFVGRIRDVPPTRRDETFLFHRRPDAPIAPLPSGHDPATCPYCKVPPVDSTSREFASSDGPLVQPKPRERGPE